MEINVNSIVFEKATLNDVPKLLQIIHRCVREINSKDYQPNEIEKFLKEFNKERIIRI